MIEKVTYGQVADLYANQSFLRLLQHQQRSDVIMLVAGVHKELFPVQADFNRQREEIAQRFAEKNEKGDPIIENGVYAVPPERVFEFNQEIAALKASEVPVRMHPIQLKITDCTGVVAADVYLMEPFISFAR